MGELTDDLDRIAVEATSPDGAISAQVAGRSITVRFRPGAYARYTEDRLAHQLGQLAAVAWTRYRRRYSGIVEEFLESPSRAGGSPSSASERLFEERLRDLAVRGDSAGGSVSVASRGLVRWEFTIAEGTLRRLSEPRLLAELATALSALLADHRYRVFLLRDQIFDLGMPQWYRTAIGLGARPQSRV